MAENAGSVYSEVRLKLDNLTHDIMTVSKKFQNMGQSMIAGVNRPSEQVRKSIEDLTAKIQSNSQALAEMTKGKNIKEYYKDLTKDIKDAEKANQAETWAALEGEKEKAKALEKEINHWEKLKAAMESKQAGLQGSEEAARMASITKLSQDYGVELDRINRLSKTGVITEQEKARMIQSAQRKEVDGLVQLEREYKGFGKEQEKIKQRIKEQAKAYKEVEAAAKQAGKGSGLQQAFNFAGIHTGLTAIVDGVKAAAQALAQFVKEGMQAYQDQEVAAARLSAVLKSTGADTWTNLDLLQDMAAQQSNATGKSTKEIQEMQAVLLGFTSITGDVFEETTEGLINMAAVMGGDLASAANQFGKALDTPAESLSTLTRYGFKFTEQQKAEIEALEEAGEHAKAQRIILGSMKDAFGNAASAINTAVASQSNFNTAISNLKAAAGEAFEKAVRPIRDFFTGLITPANDAREALNKYENSLSQLERIDVLTKEIQDFNNEITRLEGLGGQEDQIASLNLQIVAMEEELTRLNGVVGGNKVNVLTYELDGLETSLNNNIDSLFEHSKELNDYKKRIKEINNMKKAGTISEIQLKEEERKYREARAKQIGERSYQESNSGPLVKQSLDLQQLIMLKKEELAAAQETAAAEDAARKKAAEDTANAAVEEQNAKKAREEAAAAQAKAEQEHAARLEAIKNLEISYIQAIEKAERDRTQAVQEARGDTEALAAAQAQYAQAEAAALQAEIDGLHSLSVQWRERGEKDAEAEQEIKDRLALQEVEIGNARSIADITEKQAELEKSFADTEAEYEAALKQAWEQKKAGIITEEELERTEADAAESRLKQIQDLEIQYWDTAEAAEQLDRVRAAMHGAQDAFEKEQEEAENAEKIAELTKQHKDELLEVQHAKENIQKKNEKELDYQKRLIDNEKEWALAALDGLDKKSKEYQDLVDLIDQVAAAKKELLEEKGGGEKTFLGFTKDDAVQTLNDSISIIDAIADYKIAATQRWADEERKIKEEAYEEDKKLIEEEKNEKLIAAGFEVANNEASLEAQLEAAKRTGDEILIYQAERALEKQRIEDEAAEKEKQRTSQLEYDKEKIAYEAELQQWKWNITMAAVNAAAAAVTTFAKMGFTPPAFVAAGIGAVAAGIQIEAIRAAQPEAPKMPSFATGGIVPGTSYSGDNMLVRANSKEAVLTEEQQRNFMDLANGKGGGGTNATIIVMLDTREIAKSTVNLVNDGFYTIKARAIR